MRAIGLILLLLTMLIGCGLYSRRETRRMRETEGLVSLFTHLRVALGTYAPPLGEIYASYQNEALEASDFLPILRREGLTAALRQAPPLGMTEEELAPLLRFSLQLGKRFLPDELAAVDECLAYLSRVAEDRRREAPRRKRIGHALIVTSGAMVTLMLL